MVTVRKLSIPNPHTQGNLFAIEALPKEEGKYPVVIASHGYNGSHADFYDDCRYFAENGFVALAYDFAGGSSRSQSTGKSVDMSVLTEKEDLKTVISYVKSLDEVDSNNIFLLGGSQGGFVSSLVADEMEDSIRALEMYFPALCIPDDWRKNFADENAISDTIDFWGLTLSRTYLDAVKEMHVEDVTGKYKGPVLILHGDNDKVVPLHYSQEAEKRYQSAKLIVMQGEGHGFSPSSAAKARSLVLDHMKANLK